MRRWIEVLVDVSILLILIALGQNMGAPYWLIAVACLVALLILNL